MTTLTCACGQSHLTLSGPPILAVACCCNSCAKAATRLQTLPSAPKLTDALGATPFVLYRKDRIRFDTPAPLRSFRLAQESTTRRLVAPCCNTPLGLEFQGDQWLSLYVSLWPQGSAPRPTSRGMTIDRPDRDRLPGALPNAKTQSAAFMWKLLTAWIAMGFRNPKIETKPEIEA